MQLPLTLLTRKAILSMISHIEKLPGGYLFWHSLPKKGKKAPHSVTRQFVNLTQSILYPTALRLILLRVALTENGMPDSRGMALYTWLLQNWYGGQAHLLHREWFYLIHSQTSQHTSIDH